MKKIALGIFFFSFIFQSCENNTNEKIQTEVTASNENAETILDEKQEIKEQETVQLQSITLEEVENKYPMSTATEGLNISFSKNGFYNNDFIVLNYGGKAFFKVNNQIISLKEASFKNQKVGFNQVFKNNKFKLFINATNVNEVKNAEMEGWVSVQGNITLFDADGNTLQNISTFYAEGL